MSGVAISYICFNHRQDHPHMLQAAVQNPGSRANLIPLFRKAYARRQVCRAEAQLWTSILLREIDRDLEVAQKNQGLLQTHFFANLRRTPSPADTSLSQQQPASDYCCWIDRESECLAVAKVFVTPQVLILVMSTGHVGYRIGRLSCTRDSGLMRTRLDFLT